MSANNQVLVKEHNGKWYVFNKIMAESWINDNNVENELSLSRATKSFNTRAEALEYAHDLDMIPDEYGFSNSEYGVHECLAKDGADVKIVD